MKNAFFKAFNFKAEFYFLKFGAIHKFGIAIT